MLNSLGHHTTLPGNMGGGNKPEIIHSFYLKSCLADGLRTFHQKFFPVVSCSYIFPQIHPVDNQDPWQFFGPKWSKWIEINEVITSREHPDF